MKVCQTLFGLFWATLLLLLCLSYMVNATDDDLMDFDFTDLKEIDWNYDMNNSNETTAATATIDSMDDNDWRGKGHGHGTMTFDDDVDVNENQVHPFDWREKILRNALSKALTNKELRQKFVEVMPILRVLSKQQRLALSALISAQVNAKKGQELKLEQVRMMFGDDKKLLIPIVYDIARLVSNSAKKYLQFSYELMPAAQHQQQHQHQSYQHQRKPAASINRRKLDLDAVEELEDTDDVGTLPSGAMPEAQTAAFDSSLEDFFGEMPDDVLDPQSINEALQASAKKSKLKEKQTASSTTTKTTTKTTAARATRSLQSKRARRHASSTITTTNININRNEGTKEFVHKLIRSIPLSVNEEDLQKGAAGRTVKLNTTSFLLPSGNDIQQQQQQQPPTKTITTSLSTAVDLTSPSSGSLPASYQEIEDLAFASLNGTEIQLESNAEGNNAEMTAAGVDDSQQQQQQQQNEPLPSPEELIAGPRYRINNNKVRIIRPKLPSIVAKRKRVHVQQTRGSYQRPKGVLPSGSSAAALIPAPRKCERFTSSMCIRTDDYPHDQIMGSIRRHKNAMTALLAEFHDKPLNLEFTDDEFDEFGYNKRRREDEGGSTDSSGSAGSMCQSIVRYARPQKARSASGEWKYIVNTGQHTQTLRLEKCSAPQESCSYLAQNYRSHCAQVYNYHRLLSWDKTRGLHVDIFKVPTCCSCQIDGYRQQFPPLNSIKSKEFTPVYSPEPYSTINEELDYNDDEEEDELGGFQYAHNTYNSYNNNKKSKSRHASYENHATNELQLGSQSVRSKVHAAPNSPSTIGSYLTPPDSNEYDKNYAYKGGAHAASSNVHHLHNYHHQQQQQHQPHQHRTTASVTSSSKHASYQQQQQQRRRPYKSLNQGFEGESRADLEISPSETHTDKEVNIHTHTYGNDKTGQIQQQLQQQKRKRIYSVPHTATTNSLSSSSSGSNSIPIIHHTGINTSYVSSFGHGTGYDSGHGQGYGHNSYNGHYEHGQIFPSIPSTSSSTSTSTTSTSSTTAYQTSATSPSYYTPGAGKNVIRSGSANYGKSKPRYRVKSTVTQPQPNAQTHNSNNNKRTAYTKTIASNSSKSSSSSSATSPTSSKSSSAAVSPSVSLPTTDWNTIQYATTPASSPATYPDPSYPSIYHISSIFNNSVPIGGTKRINYSYHPIIDFFENGSSGKRTTSSSSTIATTTSTTARDHELQLHDHEHNQIIPHKIPKYSSVINKKLPATAVSTAVDVNGLLQYRERRIGSVAVSADADDEVVSSASDNGVDGRVGVGIDTGYGYGHSVDSNTSKGSEIGAGLHKLRTKASTEDNVWHPMLVQ